MKSRTIALAGSALVMAWASSASAQTFPADNQWIPITRGGVVIGDPTGDAQSARDIVGDANNPAAYVFGDVGYLYFRLRIADTPLQGGSGTEYKPFGWGVELDTNNDLADYEFLTMVDGINNPDVVTLEQNSTLSGQGSPKDAATTLKEYPVDTHARALAAGTALGGDQDWFIDWAIDRADLAAAGVDLSQPIRFVFGTSNSTHTLDADLISESGESLLPGLASDPVLCAGTDCCNTATSTCDGECTTDADCKDPTKPACNPDGQCRECSATNSSRCTGDRPVCDLATGTCVGLCKTDADCKDPSKPACQPDGECTECSVTNKTRCTGNEICDTQLGVCTLPCTTDADCKDPMLPACQPDGACGECSATNKTLCKTPEPVCDLLIGRCVAGCTTHADCKNPALPVCRGDGICVECSAANSTLCKEPAPVCDEIVGECVGRCATDADCKDPTRPACGASGVCVECTAANKSLCTGTRPGCFVRVGMCVGACTSDAQCTDPLWPACGPDGFCRQCSAANTKRCSPASPVCDTSVGLCAAPPEEIAATMDGSGLACATGRSERLAGLSILLLSVAGLLVTARRRKRR